MFRAGILKRGLCTFVEKCKRAQSIHYDFAMVVNTENILIDMPSVKENTQELTIPISLSRDSEGEYIFYCRNYWIFMRLFEFNLFFFGKE